VDSGLEVQLEEDGDGSTGQSGVGMSGLWSVAYDTVETSGGH